MSPNHDCRCLKQEFCVLQLKALSCPGLHMEYATGQIFPLLVTVTAPPMVMGTES